jgi:hypothetical protein
MSDRERELAARYAELRLHCALQRRAVGAEVDNVMTRFGAIDRFAVMARGTLRPGMFLAGIVGLLAFRRVRRLRSVWRIVLLAAAARRLWQTAKAL